MSDNGDPGPQPSGDDEFKEFLKQNAQGMDLPSFIIHATGKKLEKVIELYQLSLKQYEKLAAEDPLKKKMLDYLQMLMTSSTRSLDVYDYIVVKESENMEAEEQAEEERENPDVD